VHAEMMWRGDLLCCVPRTGQIAAPYSIHRHVCEPTRHEPRLLDALGRQADIALPLHARFVIP